MPSNKNKQAKNGANNGGELQGNAQRSVQPIPDIPPNSLTAFDAKDPDTKYPPIPPGTPDPYTPSARP
jgi:arylsulfatase